jgi:hypothetical protein
MEPSPVLVAIREDLARLEAAAAHASPLDDEAMASCIRCLRRLRTRSGSWRRPWRRAETDSELTKPTQPPPGRSTHLVSRGTPPGQPTEGDPTFERHTKRAPLTRPTAQPLWDQARASRGDGTLRRVSGRRPRHDCVSVGAGVGSCPPLMACPGDERDCVRERASGALALPFPASVVHPWCSRGSKPLLRSGRRWMTRRWLS